MPLFMDVHTLDDVAMEAVAGAHLEDLKVQGDHDVSYLHYGVDDRRGKVFCRSEAPFADAATTVHREAHGLVAQEIYPVEGGS